MSDFQFLQNEISGKWVVSAPRRAKRPDVANGIEPVCPFCVGREGDETELYRVQSNVIATSSEARGKQSQANEIATSSDEHRSPRNDDSNWSVRVLPNKFPFAPIHELIIHSPNHHKSFGELGAEQVELILQTYRHRYNEHSHKGQVYIFHNHGQKGGESLPHPHTQLTVVPEHVRLDIPPMDPSCLEGVKHPVISTNHFVITCPLTSQWPDEVWIAPKLAGRSYGEITDAEITDLADTLNRLIHILDLRHGHEFPFNFYIYPGGDWYVRLIPRDKTLGGFEVGTGVFVNTQDPQETIAFITKHFSELNIEKVGNTADYSRQV